jgi:hypothetical protein
MRGWRDGWQSSPPNCRSPLCPPPTAPSLSHSHALSPSLCRSCSCSCSCASAGARFSFSVCLSARWLSESRLSSLSSGTCSFLLCCHLPRAPSLWSSAMSSATCSFSSSPFRHPLVSLVSENVDVSSVSENVDDSSFTEPHPAL